MNDGVPIVVSAVQCSASVPVCLSVYNKQMDDEERKEYGARMLRALLHMEPWAAPALHQHGLTNELHMIRLTKVASSPALFVHFRVPHRDSTTGTCHN